MLYHLVCPTKYRRTIFNNEIEQTLKTICEDISNRYEIYFVEIGTDKDHVHFLLQSVPNMNPSTMVRTIKSITAKELFKQHPEIKKILWGQHFWTSGYYMNTVGQHGNEDTIKKYVQNQGLDYHQIERNDLFPQMTLFTY